MQLLEDVSLILDALLVAAALIAFQARPRIGGELAGGMRRLLVGVVILGLAHFIETVLFVVFGVDRQLNEVIHRLLVGTGFVFIIWGLVRMRQAFDH